MNLGRALRRIRFEKGMSQVDVAEKAGISQTYLSLLENGGKTEPSSKILKTLCKIYGVPSITVAWYSMEEGDVQPNKIGVYRELKPIIDSLTAEFLKTDPKAKISQKIKSSSKKPK